MIDSHAQGVTITIGAMEIAAYLSSNQELEAKLKTEIDRLVQSWYVDSHRLLGSGLASLRKESDKLRNMSDGDLAVYISTMHETDYDVMETAFKNSLEFIGIRVDSDDDVREILSTWQIVKGREVVEGYTLDSVQRHIEAIRANIEESTKS